MKKNTLYWIGRPEVSKGGRFGGRSKTYKTAIMGDDGTISYGEQTYMSNGKLAIPKNVIHVTTAEFKKLLKSIK